MSKFELIKPRPVPPTLTSFPTAALGMSRRYFEALMGLITVGVLIIPVLYYPGLMIFVVCAEVYLIDAIYTRIYGARVKLSLPLERGTSVRKSPIGFFDDLSVTRATGFALLNR